MPCSWLPCSTQVCCFPNCLSSPQSVQSSHCPEVQVFFRVSCPSYRILVVIVLPLPAGLAAAAGHGRTWRLSQPERELQQTSQGQLAVIQVRRVLSCRPATLVFPTLCHHRQKSGEEHQPCTITSYSSKHSFRLLRHCFSFTGCAQPSQHSKYSGPHRAIHHPAQCTRPRVWRQWDQ